MNTTNTNVDTRAAAGAEAITTALTINWEGMSIEDTRALAQQALIVKLQGGWRKNGIPTEVTVNAADHKVGVRAPKGKPDLAAMLASLSAEERAALLAKFAG